MDRSRRCGSSALVNARDLETLDPQFGTLAKEVRAAGERRRERVRWLEGYEPCVSGRQPAVEQREQRHAAIQLPWRGQLRSADMLDDRRRVHRREADVADARDFHVVYEPAHDARRAVVGHRYLNLLAGPPPDRREHGREGT